MHKHTGLALLALALVSAPLSAQGRATQEKVKGRTASGTVVTSDGRVVRTSDGTVLRSRSSVNIPPGQLPPKGMCRVWIDGVPPGQQPPVTDCATAERNRVANSRVIYGDRDSFPGRGRGKFRGAKSSSAACSVRDAVVIDGRAVDVCNDGTVDDRRGRRGRGVRGDDDGDDDDDLDRAKDREDREDHGNRGKGKSGKSGKHGNRGHGSDHD